MYELEVVLDATGVEVVDLGDMSNVLEGELEAIGVEGELDVMAQV